MDALDARTVRAEPDLLWNWVLARQGVYAGNGLGGLHEVVDRTLGLHAARVQTPFVTAAVRLSEPDMASGLLGSVPQPDLMTIRGVRRTLHVMIPAHATASHGATVHYRMGNVTAVLRREHLLSTNIDIAAKAIVSQLAKQGARRERELESALTELHTTREVRLGLKSAWESGRVAFHNASGSWDALQRTFDVASTWHPAFDSQLPRERATAQLLTEYFERYGPATVGDAAWWSALGQTTVREALRGLPLVRLSLPWSTSDFFMTEQAWAEFQSDIRHGRVITSGITLLSHEDCALKAYNESRDRYLQGQSQSCCFNSIGEVRPTIVKDGHVVGLWHWDRKTMRISCRHFPGSTTAGDRAIAVRLANDLSLLLRKHSRLRLRGSNIEYALAAAASQPSSSLQ